MSGARRQALVGAGLVVIYTGLIAAADAITKRIADGFEAPQMFAVSGAIVVGLSLLLARGKRAAIRTGCPRSMMLRSAATVMAAVAFFQAFRLLPFADVFLFIGVMPVLAALMSGAILGEYPRPAAWGALLVGAVGVACLFPAGLHAVEPGHLWAGFAAVSGTFSMVMARFIGRHESNAIAQVLWPNLALFAVSLVGLPLVWRPMGLAELGWIAGYAGVLFLARWVSVVALRLLPAYAVTPLMNLQFVWMITLGALAFGEWPAAGTLLGAAIVIASGIYLLWDQMRPERRFERNLRIEP
ncbi:DMT family transporter [Pseudodonghicola sp.]|uniref:DMT family transporter n=1 Tax=Pseudodonghicola sp. TaxID=1969463 RepID=UPI003A96ED5B